MQFTLNMMIMCVMAYLATLTSGFAQQSKAPKDT
jgi:hypothetical protein